MNKGPSFEGTWKENRKHGPGKRKLGSGIEEEQVRYGGKPDIRNRHVPPWPAQVSVPRLHFLVVFSSTAIKGLTCTFSRTRLQLSGRLSLCFCSAKSRSKTVPPTLPCSGALFISFVRFCLCHCQLLVRSIIRLFVSCSFARVFLPLLLLFSPQLLLAQISFVLNCISAFFGLCCLFFSAPPAHPDLFCFGLQYCVSSFFCLVFFFFCTPCSPLGLFCPGLQIWDSGQLTAPTGLVAVELPPIQRR